MKKIALATVLSGLIFTGNAAASDDDFFGGYAPANRDINWNYFSAGFNRDSYDSVRTKYSLFEIDGVNFSTKFELNNNFFVEGDYLTASGEVKSGAVGTLFISDIETTEFKVGAGYKFKTEKFGEYFASAGYHSRELTNKRHRIMSDEVDKGQYIKVGVKKAFTKRFDVFADGTYVNLSEGTSISGESNETYLTVGANVFITKKLFVSTSQNWYDNKSIWQAQVGYAF